MGKSQITTVTKTAKSKITKRGSKKPKIRDESVFDEKTYRMRKKDAENGEQHAWVFVLEKTQNEFDCTLESVDDITDAAEKLAVETCWDTFATCARAKICEDMVWDRVGKVNHKTIGSCPPIAFYLFMKQHKNAEIFNWTQNRRWNGMIVKDHCIQFRFKNGNHPVLHTHDDWAHFSVTTTQGTDDEDIGVITRVKTFNLESISLTCNCTTNEVYTSFRYSKTFKATASLCDIVFENK